MKDKNYHKILNDTHTQKRMKMVFKEVVLNPKISEESDDPKKVWLAAHPEECLMPMDVIHHINGYHHDNHPKNLLKTTMGEHQEIHTKGSAITLDMQKKRVKESLDAYKNREITPLIRPETHEPKTTTMIRVNVETRDELVASKIDENETIGDVIKRMILEIENMPTTEMPI